MRLVLIMVSRGRLIPWTVFALLSKVISSMVSVLPPPAVSCPTRRKVYTPGRRPLLATSGSSAPSKFGAPSPWVVPVPPEGSGISGSFIHIFSPSHTPITRMDRTTSV